MLKVFGHQSPDTDTTCSAIIWSWYLNEHTGTEAKPFILGTLNKETEFVLNHWGAETPDLLESLSEEDSVVIVDTNNPQELFENINQAKIVEIIDHHKLVGGLSTDMPPKITMRPLSCTATIMHDLMVQNNVNIPKPIAGLIISCILSDTLEFRSPTTTPHDKDIAEKLAKDHGVNISEYANLMFEAKSDISDFSDSGLIKLDSKKYEVGDLNFRISVVETTNPKTVLERKAGIIKAIKELLGEEKDVNDVLFFVVDILKEEATVFTYSELTKKVVSKSFGVSVEGDTEILPGIVSRKKQILPVLKV